MVAIAINMLNRGNYISLFHGFNPSPHHVLSNLIFNIKYIVRQDEKIHFHTLYEEILKKYVARRY